MALRVVAIDWSGAKQGARRKIWLAEAVEGRISRVECGRDRREVVEELAALRRSGDELVAGLDFAFSFPAWYVRSWAAGSAPELWDRLVDGQADEILAGCEDPFWGRPRRGRPRGVPKRPALRRTERVTAELAKAGVTTGPRIRPKSVFQIGGAGAVGTGSLRGMVELRSLRAAGFSICPFDDPGLPLVVEIYPRVLTGPVVKSRGDARRAYLELHGCGDRMSPEAFAAAASSEDAFDAAVSALALAEHADDLLSLPAIVDAQLRMEGIIWQPGWRDGHPPPPPRKPSDPPTATPPRTRRTQRTMDALPGARGSPPGALRGSVPRSGEGSSATLILHHLEPWHWAVAGLAIGAITLLLLWVGRQRLGISTGLENLCALAIDAPYLRRGEIAQSHAWRLPFLGGLVLGGLLSAVLAGGWSPLWDLGRFDAAIGLGPAGKLAWMFGGGLLIGFGTRMAGGCTSGHGIFGVSNFERASLESTLAFVAAGILTTNLVYRVAWN